MLQKLTLFLYCCLSTLFLFAQKVSIGPQPLWLYKVTPDLSRVSDIKSISEGYYLELIDKQTNLVTNTTYSHFIRNIVNESGVQNASEVSVTFAPEFQRLTFHKIALIRDGKQVNKLTASEIKVIQEEEDAADFQYNGLKRAFVLLRDVRKNDRIEVAYSLTGFNPVFDNKFYKQIYFAQSTALVNYFETIIAPENRLLKFKYFNGAATVKEKTAGKNKIYYWENPSQGYWETQPGVPSWFDNYPSVSITEFNNWKEVVDWALKTFNKYEYTLPADILNKMAGWRSSAKGDKDEFAESAIQFVQNEIRYLGLEMGPNTHQPHAPAEVCRARYGDCKDKALLLATILRKENIPAYVAFVNTTERDKLAESAPGFGEFDHAIVAIERSSDYIFIDATRTNQRGGLVNRYVPAYGKALVIRDGENGLREVTPGFLNATYIKETLYAPFNKEDKSSLEVSTSYQGGAADNIRNTLSGSSIADIEKEYLQYYDKMFSGIKQAQDISYKDDSLQNKLEVKEKYSIPELWHQNASGADELSVYARPIYERLPDPVSSYKNAPLALAYPMDIKYSLTLHMPRDWSFPFDFTSVKNDSYEFSFNPSINGDIITIDYHLKTFRDNIPANELAAYKADYKKLKEVMTFDLSFNPQTAGDKPGSRAIKTVNWPSVWYAFLLVGLLIFLFNRFNRHGANVIYTPESAWPIGGWTILLGLTIFGSMFVQIFNFINNNYFSLDTVNALGTAGGATLQALFYLEFTFYLLLPGASIAIFYWFIKRRDIFPAMFIWYVAFLAGGQLILMIGYAIIPFPGSERNFIKENSVELIRTLIYAAVWVTYVIRSERVRSTFLKEYE